MRRLSFGGGRADPNPALDSDARRPFVLLHSGIIYRSERDPKDFFAAVAALKQSGAVSASDLRVVLRASGDDSGFRRDVEALGIDDIVRLEPPSTTSALCVRCSRWMGC